MPTLGKITPRGEEQTGKEDMEGEKKEGRTEASVDQQMGIPYTEGEVKREENGESKKAEREENGETKKVDRDAPPPSCKKCFINFAERSSLVCDHEFCANCWESLVTVEPDKTDGSAVFVCPVCGARNEYKRPRSAHPNTTIETLEKCVKKVKQFRCQLKREKILPEAMVVSCMNEFIFVDTGVKRIIVTGDSGEVVSHFPYLRQHQFQGGLGVAQDGLILVALRNDRFSGVSYYERRGQFKFSAFLYDDSPQSGSIPSLDIDPDGHIVVLDNDRLNLCYINKQKQVDVHPQVFKSQRPGFRIDESNNGLEKRDRNPEKNMENKIQREDLKTKQDGSDVDGKDTASNGKEAEDGPDVNDNGETLQNDPVDKSEQEATETEGTGSKTGGETEGTGSKTEGAEGTGSKTEGETEGTGSKTEDKGSKTEGETEKEESTRDDKECENDCDSTDNPKQPTKRSHTPLTDSTKANSLKADSIRADSITSVAVNSWGQIFLCNLDNQCIHIQEKSERHDTEMSRIDLSSYLQRPTCRKTGKISCDIDDNDNIILLERFTNTVHRLSCEGQYIDSLVKFPMKDVTMYEDHVVYSIVDMGCMGRGSIALMVRREEGTVTVDGESGEGIWQPTKKTMDVHIYTYTTPRKYRRKDVKPTYSSEGELVKPRSACCTVM